MQVHCRKIENLKDIFFYQRAAKEGKPDVMILAKEATRVEVANDTANVVDLVQGRRYEIFRDNQNILKQSSSLIVYV